MVTNS